MTRKTDFFEGYSSFKFNLGLAQGAALTFYISVAKEGKLKVRKFWGLIPTFVEVTGEQLVGEGFLKMFGDFSRLSMKDLKKCYLHDLDFASQLSSQILDSQVT